MRFTRPNPIRRTIAACTLIAAQATVLKVTAVELTVTEDLHHLRSTDEREWTEFPEKAEGRRLDLSFVPPESESKHFTLFVRHRDVKHRWRIDLNGKKLAELPRDENHMVSSFELGSDRLVEGENRLSVVPISKKDDDILVGAIRIVDAKRDDLLRRATLDVHIKTSGQGRPLPGRVTVIDEHAALAPIGTKPADGLAIRTGTIYTGNGRAKVGLAPGKYTVFVGRGFEYSVRRYEIELARGETRTLNAGLTREVDTNGLVACDTHIHTLEHSGHGDASVAERVVTIAGEGIELPIATDHDKHIDFEPTAKRLGVRKWFTPVVGNEYTTGHGHFNIFPVEPNDQVPDNHLETWESIFHAIRAVTDAEIAILNHPRDVHRGYRPFGPRHHNWVVGENLDGETLEADGVEVINSAALQTEPLRLVEDWLALVNRGYKIAPIGASDSHEVWTKIVGQGRTYVRCDDSRPEEIDVSKAVRSIREGRVVASLGLLARLTVDRRYRPGDLVNGGRDLLVEVEVQGPAWANCSKIVLYVNGIETRLPDRVDCEKNHNYLLYCSFTLKDLPSHDVHLTVAALGHGSTAPHFTIPKTYQPTSKTWKPYLLSVPGVVHVDGEGDGRWQSAHEIAEGLVKKHGAKLEVLLTALTDSHASVASHVALLLDRRGVDIQSDAAKALLSKSREATRLGFDRFLAAKRQSDEARKLGR